jgi:CheY-like chemotaxis protein
VGVEGQTNHTILVVDDDASVRRVVARALSRCGFCVLEADGPTQALALVGASAEISLVVSDVEMPGMNGFDLVERLREQRAGMPALFISGACQRSEQLRDPLLAKPFTEDELLDTIQRLLATGPPACS